MSQEARRELIGYLRHELDVGEECHIKARDVARGTQINTDEAGQFLAGLAGRHSEIHPCDEFEVKRWTDSRRSPWVVRRLDTEDSTDDDRLVADGGDSDGE